MSQLKLTDFGMSEHFVRQDSRACFPSILRFRQYVTPMYRPPELWDVTGEDLSIVLSRSVDFWGFACVLLEIVTAKKLFAPHKHISKCPHESVQAWCQVWPFVSGRMKLRNGRSFTVQTQEMARKLFTARLNEAGAMQKVILKGLNPNPIARGLPASRSDFL